MLSESLNNKYRDLYEILKETKIGICDQNTTDDPFFRPCLDSINIDALFNQEENCEFITQVSEFSDKYNIPFELKNLYIYLGVDNREIVLHNFSLFSFKELIKRQQLLQREGQNDIIDLGTQYIGMGHIRVLTFNIKTGNCFLRYDGGGNGWEQDDNWKKTLEISGDEIDDKNQFSFMDFLTNAESFNKLVSY